MPELIETPVVSTEPTEPVETQEPTEPTEPQEPTEPITPVEPDAEGLQKQLDDERGRREKAEAKWGYWEREAQRVPEPTPPKAIEQPVVDKPAEDSFENYGDYVEALADWKFEQRESGRRAVEAELERTQEQQDFSLKMAQEASSHDNYWDVVRNPNLPLSPQMLAVLAKCDKGAQVVYHLGANLSEAARISRLDPVSMTMELAQMNARLSSGPPQKIKNNAIAPTKPVEGVETVEKKPEDMSHKEYRAWREGGGGG